MEQKIKMKDRYIGETIHFNLGQCQMYCDDERGVYYLINNDNQIQKIAV